MSVSLGELAVRFGCELRGDPEVRVERVATLANADARSLSFLANPSYRAQLAAHARRRGGARARVARRLPGAALLLCDNPYATYARIAALLYPAPPLAPGVHPDAPSSIRRRSIDPSAEIGPLRGGRRAAPASARAPDRPALRASAQDVPLGADVRLVARVTLGRGVQIGARSVLHPGVVIGADGFGFAPERGAGSRCRRSAACASATTSRSAPTPPSTAAPSRTP